MDQPQTPLVSVIVSCYNYGKYVGQTIKSVLAQTYTNWELIIVDDASTDNSVEIIRSYVDPRIMLLISEINQDWIRSSNWAYSKCRGKYVAVLDADDYIAPDRLAKQVSYLEAHPEIDIVGTYINEVDQDSQLVVNGEEKAWFNQVLDLNEPDKWLLGNHLCHSSSVIRKTSRDRVGPYNTELLLLADYEFWVRCLIKGLQFHVINEPLTYYRKHTTNRSRKHPQTRVACTAYIFCSLLAPYFARIGRQDLIDLHHLSFLDLPYFRQRGISLAEAKDIILHLLTLQGTDLEPAQFIAYFEKKLVKPLTYQNFPYALAGTARLTDNRAAYLREVVKSRRQTLQYPVKKQLPPKLVIFDDKFPTILSSFRVTEFNHYLRHLNSIIYSFNPNFEQNLQTYIGYYPEYRNRIFPYKRRTYSNLNASLFYIIFLNNAYRFLPEIENTQTPFIFTLYPGGGFELDQPASDLKLNTVIRSRLFRKVIVTQKVTYDYLLSKNLCAPEKIEYIYGGVEPADYFQEHNVPKVFYKKDKATFDICFVAHKYMPKGINKGYHTFISTAKILARLNKDFRFHVVGNYGPDDITIEGLENRVKFYGSQHLSFFPEFYSRMDMILSPNIPFVHAPGNFDGFPTGCCVEAGFAGVAVLHADVLNENQDNTYLPDKELCIINTNPDDIANKVLYYFNNLDQLYALSKAGQSKFYEIYSSKSQLDSRLALLKKYI